MSRYVFDIESDNLLRRVTRCWIVYTYNLDTKEKKYYLEGDKSWIEVFNNAKLLVGHNIVGYDIPALEKLFGWRPNPKTALHDTLLLSQILDYNRFPGSRHGLESWGEHLGYNKIDFNDFSKYSEEMLTYCERDVMLNVKVYNALMEELKSACNRTKRPEMLKMYIRAEHAVAKWCAQAELHGWPFDVEKAKEYFVKMTEELEAARAQITPLLGMKTVAKDKRNGEVEWKEPKWVKNGCYDRHTANWFEIDPENGLEDRLIEGPYSRVEFKHLDLDSINDVKIFLFRNNWEPTEWNYKYEFDEETGRRNAIKTSPKITEDSLEVMQGNGKMYCDFLTTKSRHSILKTWLEEVDENGNLHGECFTIGTPSMRARHSIIVNVPSADAAWGKEMRSLFTCKPGWKLIGCDSAGNQARGLAHYLNNPEFVDLLLNGDIHQYNADVLTKVLKEDLEIDHVVPRSVAKRILYAFLFGASGAKLWSYVFGTQNKPKGNKLRAGFLKAVPGFENLLTKLEKIYGSTKKKGDGYILSLADNKIYVDSFHKLLVYLLQSCEKITCGTAVMLTMQRLEEEGIPYIPCIMMHDEEDFQVPEEYAERAAQIGKESFKEGPKLYGITIMDGDAKIGNNWYEVH